MASRLPASTRDWYGEVDKFKQAQAAAHRRFDVHGVNALRVDHDDFARLNVADKLRAHRVERAALARQHKAVADPPQTERANAIRIANADELVLGQQHQRVAAAHLLHHGADGLDQPLAAFPRNQVQDDLGIHRRLENRAVVLHLRPERIRVDQIAVVCQRQHADLAPRHQRLRVDYILAAEGRIAHVADGDAPRQPVQNFLVKHLRYKPEVAVMLDSLAVRHRDTGAFLPAVLQSKQTVIRGLRHVDGFVLRVNAEYAA